MPVQVPDSEMVYRPRSTLHVAVPELDIVIEAVAGSGKTTTAAKLAKWLIAQDKKPMLAACDVQRPAAIKQLEVLGESVGVPVYAKTDGTGPVAIAKEAR